MVLASLFQRSLSKKSAWARGSQRTWLPNLSRRVTLFIGVLCLALFALVQGVLHAAAPPPAPASVNAGKSYSPRLTQHVLLVIVDGLRYDIATNPERMPKFAEAMQTHTHGEIWAGPVSMTSSAVLAIGVGQRGRLEQIIRNLDAAPAQYNSWIANAKASGLRVMTVGDPAWAQLYSQWLARYASDPEGVAIDVDFNPVTFKNARDLHALQPDLLVTHFVTPDHQGHAYGIQSTRYRQHIREFDRQLAEFLSEFDPGWTVLVTSDHGAADSGTHGTDVNIQRRSPIYAYGPGLVQQPQTEFSLDQLELSVILPLLLGVTPPAHGVGRATVEWLNLPDMQRGDVACEHARRVLMYAHAAGAEPAGAQAHIEHCSSASTVSERVTHANEAVRLMDGAVMSIVGLGAQSTLLWALLGGLLAVVAFQFLVNRFPLHVQWLAGAVVAITVALVAQVERLPGVWPNVVRAVLFVLGNGALLIYLIVPIRAVSVCARWLPLTLLLPVVLAATYPSDTRPECVIISIIVAINYLLVSPRRTGLQQTGRIATASQQLTLRAPSFWWLLLLFLILVPVLLREGSVYSAITPNEWSRRGLAFLLVCLFSLWLKSAAQLRNNQAWLAWAVLALPVAIHPVVPAWLGRSGWVVGAVTFVWLLKRAKLVWVIVAGLFSLLWIVRAFEVLPLLATVSLAWMVGSRLAGRTQHQVRYLDWVPIQLLGISLMFALRMGYLDGLDFGGMDWNAGAFRDPSVSASTVGFALATKAALGASLIAIALAGHLNRGSEIRVLMGLSVYLALRAIALAATFFFAGKSYWTAMRVLADLPSAGVMALGCALLLALRSVNLTALFHSTRCASAHQCQPALPISTR